MLGKGKRWGFLAREEEKGHREGGGFLARLWTVKEAARMS